MGVAITGAQYLWPGRIIPYVIDPQLPDADEVKAAIDHWNETNVVRFEQRTAEPDYVLVTRIDGCTISEVGRRRGEQKVCLADDCPVGSIVHELGHTIGLWHEHCRHDRDDYVRVLFDDIDDASKEQFTIDSIAGEPTPTFDIGAYDFGSIMHYSETACAFIEDTPVLIPKAPLEPGVEQGQRKALSPGDVESVEQLYKDIPRPA